MENFIAIQTLIESSGENSDDLAVELRRNGMAHISFSQISTVEACPYRYFLQYIRFEEPVPAPDYFTKGKLLHELIAASYREGIRGEPPGADGPAARIGAKFNGDAARHLQNAFETHRENRWQDCQVMGVEKPFVMMLEPDLPPCVGVIDLILKKDEKIILIDHKTGRDFYPDDELQMAIYMEYLRQAFGEEECEFYYEHYRWVNNLERIRKPAFQRVRVTPFGTPWKKTLERIRQGSEMIEEIRAGCRPARSGECFRCPYRKNCRE